MTLTMEFSPSAQVSNKIFGFVQGEEIPIFVNG